MNQEQVMSHWFADIYDQSETQTDDIEFLLSVIGKEPKSILEVACGTGRILIPLAQTGHNAMGVDRNADMLARIKNKTKNLRNLKYFNDNACVCDWGEDYDVVVLAGNILLNIECDLDYKISQQMFIHKASRCLKSGGYVYLDFDLLAHPEQHYNCDDERVIFEGTDDRGTYGKCIIFDSIYDSETQIIHGRNRKELATREGEQISIAEESVTHIRTLGQVRNWLSEAGFAVE